MLARYGIPVVRTLAARDAEEAGRRAAELGGPAGGRFALKILSPDVIHKTEAGGVALDLGSPEEVRREAHAMAARVRAASPGARLDGFAVEEMIRRPGAHELILGMSEDRQFGPVLLFGHGGIATEVIADRALALPPLNLNLARELMARTRVFRLLQGYRDRKPAALERIAFALVRLSQLIADQEAIVELDINPLLADAAVVIALDARIRVRAGAPARGPARLAIRPYPRELESEVEIAGLGRLRLRPIRPEDESALRAAFHKLRPEDVRSRFFAPMTELSREMAARLTQIDYDREMALVLELAGTGARASEIAGVVRIAADPDGERAEFAVIVRSDLKRRGLGLKLMERIIAYARQRGIRELFGDILGDNAAMLALARQLGFAVTTLSVERDILRASLRL